ncbi:MAG: helix-turn-helix domain-containing protein [bacterium]
MNTLLHTPYLHPLGDQLWAGGILGGRASDVTPIYIDRYDGPRSKRALASHSFWELGTVRSGEGMLITSTKLPLCPFRSFLIPAQLSHTELAESNIDIIWVGLRGQALDQCPTGAVLHVDDRQLTEFVERMWLYAEGGGCLGVELDGMTRLVVARLLRLSGSDTSQVSADRTESTIAYINQNYKQCVRIADLAARAQCSVSYLRRTFESRTGQSPSQYLASIRMRQAQRLLEHSALSVGEISQEVGYEDAFYFCRVFKRHTGMSPLRFRQNSHRGMAIHTA